MKYSFWMVVAGLFGLLPGMSAGQGLAHERSIGHLEVVATVSGAMPTGVTVSNHGRVFVNFPRWGDDVHYTVAEIVNGNPVPYPNAKINKSDPQHAAETLLSVQSVVVDPTGTHLWIVDTGHGFGPLVPGGPKLVEVDLATNSVVRTIPIPLAVATPNTYLNDVRFALHRGAQGMAFISDSRNNGIIVVDLASGKSWRHLQYAPSALPEPDFLPVVEGAVLYRGGKRFFGGTDGIAVGPAEKWLYYTVLTGRHLFRVPIDMLLKPAASDAAVAASVQDLGEKGGASDGIEADAEGRIYLTDYEHDSIHRRDPNGHIETLVHDPRLLWPDTLSLGNDGYLYVTANQIHRQASFQGRDERQQPYVIFRLKVDATRINE